MGLFVSAFSTWSVACAVGHVLVGAVWFGAMFYSLVVLHPRARGYFRSVQQFEELIAVLASGARWKVISAIAFIGLTGLFMGIAAVREGTSDVWKVCIVVKAVLLLIASAVFGYASWVLWPARVLASADEAVAYQRQFRVLGLVLLFLVGLNAALGVVAGHLR